MIRYVRYLDTGGRDPDHSLYRWLERALPEASLFACQTGYFSADGIYPLETQFRELLALPGAMHLVVGANEAGIRGEDLAYVLDLYESAPQSATTSLTVVAADDLLMHPKTYYIEYGDGRRSALVGSANFTHAGLSRNIEAALALDSLEDAGAPFDQIRDAIFAWSVPNSSANSLSVDRGAIAALTSDGALDAGRITPLTPANAKIGRGATFPPMGALLPIPRRRRSVVPKVTVARPPKPLPVPVGTMGTLPIGAIGIIKRVSSLDTKAFRGEAGTAYLALPAAVATYLPMMRAGSNGEPRLNVSIEARLDSVPDEVAGSGRAETNITHVGMGVERKSHSDLRLNFLSVIKTGVQYIASRAKVAVPAAGDLAAVEFLEGARVRITFISDPSSIANLMPLLDQRANGWGWLPPGVIGSWECEEGPQD